MRLTVYSHDAFSLKNISLRVNNLSVSISYDTQNICFRFI